MTVVLTLMAILASVAVVVYEVRSSRRQQRDSRRAEQIASAFFDLYDAWALNRRAQLEPVHDDLLRTSAAGYYGSAFRLTALLDDDALEQLKRFMEGGLGDADRGSDSFDALWQLHCTVSKALGYQPTPKSQEIFKGMFWPYGRNVPSVMVGTIDSASLAAEVESKRRATAGLPEAEG